MVVCVSTVIVNNSSKIFRRFIFKKRLNLALSQKSYYHDSASFKSASKVYTFYKYFVNFKDLFQIQNIFSRRRITYQRAPRLILIIYKLYYNKKHKFLYEFKRTKKKDIIYTVVK
jgi:hypothetical protein